MHMYGYADPSARDPNKQGWFKSPSPSPTPAAYWDEKAHELKINFVMQNYQDYGVISWFVCLLSSNII